MGVIKEFKKRKKQVRKSKLETTDIVTFVEIKLTKEQLEVMSKTLFGWNYEELDDYYREKIHGRLLISDSVYTTREDVPDFQYLINLGLKAMKDGFPLPKYDEF